MSDSFTTMLRYGVLSGWRVHLVASTTAGQRWRVMVTLEVPVRPGRPPLLGGMVFAPHVEGFALVHDLYVNAGGHDRARAVADHMLDLMRDAVPRRAEQMGDHLPVWPRVVEAADHAFAEHYARTGSTTDVRPGPFTVVGRLLYDGATGVLEDLRADLTFDEIVAAGRAVTA